MEKTARTSFGGSSLTPLATLDSPISQQDTEALKNLSGIYEVSGVNFHRWQSLRDEDLQLASSLINLSDKPKECDVENLDEFYESLRKQSLKIANFLSAYTEVVNKQSEVVSEVKRLQDSSGLSTDFKWKTLTLQQLCRQEEEVLSELSQEYAIKESFYGRFPHGYDKSELEIYRTMLRYPDRTFNFRFIANTFVDIGKG